MSRQFWRVLSTLVAPQEHPASLICTLSLLLCSKNNSLPEVNTSAKPTLVRTLYGCRVSGFVLSLVSVRCGEVR